MVRCRTSANCSTATTSSNDVMNAKSAPEITPGKINGICTLKKVRTGPAPIFALARVNDLSNPESVAVTVMITNGVPKTACARIIPQYVLTNLMSAKKKANPDAVITNGTIIGEINNAIIGRRHGISLEARPIAASVPRAVDRIVARIPM